MISGAPPLCRRIPLPEALPMCACNEIPAIIATVVVDRNAIENAGAQECEVVHAVSCEMSQRFPGYIVNILVGDFTGVAMAQYGKRGDSFASITPVQKRVQDAVEGVLRAYSDR
jgi:hypothetical protein